MVHLSPGYTPPLLRGLVIHPENPFEFDFIIHSGDSGLKEDDPKLREKYALVG